TPSGGWHLIFKHLPGLRTSSDKFASGVEVRANGPHIIWWPAHSGRVLCEGPVMEFPSWLLAEIKSGRMGTSVVDDALTGVPIPPDREPTARELKYAKVALGNACYEMRHCLQGSRNTKLNNLGYSLGRLIVRGWISRERVEDYLLKASAAC